MRYVVRNSGNGRGTLDRWMDDIFSTLPTWEQERYPVDVRELEDRYVLEAEMPGFSQQDVEIRIENDLLTIRGRLPHEETTDDARYVLRERRRSNRERSFSVPRDVDRDRIEARFKDGILYLELFKSEEAKPRTIEVQGE